MRLRLGVLIAAVFSTSPDKRNPDLSRIPVSSGYRFFFEPTIYKEEFYRLHGVPLFSLWYSGHVETDNPAVNFIIVETPKGESSDGIPQALAYAGIRLSLFTISLDKSTLTH